MSPKHWIELIFGGDITDSEIIDMVRESYGIVRTKYTPKPKTPKPKKKMDEEGKE